MHCTCIMRRFLVAKWSLYVMGLSLNNSFPFATIYFYPKEKVGVPPFESFWILLNPFESFWHITTKHQIQFTQCWRVVPDGPCHKTLFEALTGMLGSSPCDGQAAVCRYHRPWRYPDRRAKWAKWLLRSRATPVIHGKPDEPWCHPPQITISTHSWKYLKDSQGVWQSLHGAANMKGHQHNVPVLLHLLAPNNIFQDLAVPSISTSILPAVWRITHPHDSSEASVVAAPVDPAFGLRRGQNAPPLWQCCATHPGGFGCVHPCRGHPPISDVSWVKYWKPQVQGPRGNNLPWLTLIYMCMYIYIYLMESSLLSNLGDFFFTGFDIDFHQMAFSIWMTWWRCRCRVMTRIIAT